MKVEDIPEEIRSFVALAPVCRMASIGPDGEPHVVPLCPVFDGERVLYVDVGRKSVNARNVGANPAVEVVIDEYHNDWSRLRGIILLCRARPADDYERDAAWRLIEQKFPQYENIKWEPRLTLALEIVSWSAWGFPARII